MHSGEAGIEPLFEYTPGLFLIPIIEPLFDLGSVRLVRDSDIQEAAREFDAFTISLKHF